MKIRLTVIFDSSDELSDKLATEFIKLGGFGVNRTRSRISGDFSPGYMVDKYIESLYLELTIRTSGILELTITRLES